MYSRKITRLILAVVAAALVLILGAVSLHGLFFQEKNAESTLSTGVTALLFSLLIGIALLGTLTFILKRAERAGRADRILLKLRETALESVEEGIVLTDRNEYPVWFNTTLLQMTRLTRDGADQIPLLLPISPSRSREFYKTVRETILNGNIWHGTIETEGTDGTDRTEEVTILPLKIESDEVDHFVSIRRDLTKRKQMEGELLTARNRADEVAHLKSELLAGLSDDLRPQLLDIIGTADRALEIEPNENRKTDLETIYVSAEILIRTIQDTLDFSRLETGTVELAPKPFKLRTTMGSVMKDVAPRADGRNVELILRIPPDMPDELVGDSQRLRKVLLNLLDNALYFTSRGEVRTEVRVLQREANRITIEFEVSDSGAGIPEDALSAISEMLAHGEKSVSSRAGGTGLGLAISARLVKMMGGAIHAESIQGRGSTFRFSSLFDVEGEAPLPISMPDAIRERKMKVLVVDDNTSNREIVSEMLTRFELEPVCADTPAGASDLAADSELCGSPFGLALIDSTMPAMNGLELIENLREKNLLKCPVILMTAVERGNRFKSITRHGTISFISKPVQEDGLRSAIVYAITRESTQSEPVRPEGGGPDPETYRPLRILLAEDHPVNQKLAVRSLEKKGHRVTVANNGIEAVQACERDTFDVILMDLLMPKMDGIEAARTIRKMETMTGDRTPIIALTANAGLEDKERCRDAGMDEFLSKPVRARKLYETIQRLVPRTANAGQAESEDEAGPPHVSTPSPFDGIDIASALELVDGDENILREMAGILIDCMPNMLTNIREAARDGDRQKLIRAAHNMKGSVGNVCATDAMDAAARIETLAEKGDMNAAVEATGELEDVVERLRPSLNRLGGRESCQ